MVILGANVFGEARWRGVGAVRCGAVVEELQFVLFLKSPCEIAGILWKEEKLSWLG